MIQLRYMHMHATNCAYHYACIKYSTSVCMFMYMYEDMFMYMHVHVQARMYMYMYAMYEQRVCMLEYMYMHVHVQVLRYICTHPNHSSVVYCTRNSLNLHISLSLPGGIHLSCSPRLVVPPPALLLLPPLCLTLGGSERGESWDRGS